MFEKIQHIGYLVADLDAAVQWFKTGFGGENAGGGNLNSSVAVPGGGRNAFIHFGQVETELIEPADTSKYCAGELDVATTVAISGAAFSPAILKSPLLFVMTMLLNLRLGQWLPNPSKDINTKKSRKVTMINILRDFFRTLLADKQAKAPEKWNYCFVSDGGHNDNLGISPLLFQYKFINPKRKWAPNILLGAGASHSNWDDVAERELEGEF